jgi:hypothetical protein
VVGLARSPVEAMAIMARRRFASGSSGMTVPVNQGKLQGTLQGWSTDPQSITIPGYCARESLADSDHDEAA